MVTGIAGNRLQDGRMESVEGWDGAGDEEQAVSVEILSTTAIFSLAFVKRE